MDLKEQLLLHCKRKYFQKLILSVANLYLKLWSAKNFFFRFYKSIMNLDKSVQANYIRKSEAHICEAKRGARICEIYE